MHGTVLSCPLQQCFQKHTSMAAATPVGIHSHRRDVQFIGHHPAAGHPQQGFGLHKTDAEAPGVVQLTPPLLCGPEAVERPLIQCQTGLLPGRVKTQDLRSRSAPCRVDS